ncbi:interleukin-15 isoform 1-T1 [Aulostomus maculatus]
MTAPPATLVQLVCPGDPGATGAQFQLISHLYQGSHKAQVWLCFFVLSLLSTFTCAVSAHDSDSDLLICLTNVTPCIEKSDAMLYAPSMNGKEICQTIYLKCYILELIMVLDEEEIDNDDTRCIRDFIDTLNPELNLVRCPPCEIYPLKNITEFMKSLNNLLEARASLHADKM